MTSEVVILNKSAVALAADSAAVIGSFNQSDKRFSTNKIFRLSKNLPIAMMIYGNSEFMFTPWELIINEFSKNINHKTYSKLNEYASAFISFLESNKMNLEYEEQTDFIKNWIAGSILYGLVREGSNDSVYISSLEYNPKEKKHLFSPQKFNEILGDELNKLNRQLLEYPNDNHFLDDNQLSTLIYSLVDFVIEQIDSVEYPWIKHLTSNNKKLLKEYLVTLIRRKSKLSEDTESSGLVIVGFGENEIYPSICSYTILGLFNNKLKYEKIEEKSSEISRKNQAMVIPFAQSDVIDTILYGIDQKYFQEGHRSFITDFATENLSKGIKEAKLKDYKENNEIVGFIKKFRSEDEEYKKFIFKNYVDYYFDALSRYSKKHLFKETLSYIRFLPKEELANIAENLVSSTSIKRMISGGFETVAGPTDVVLLSKKDGFIWVKKKESFNLMLNPHLDKHY